MSLAPGDSEDLAHWLRLVLTPGVGPSTARGVVVTDTVPAGVTITSAFHGTATPCGVSGQTVTCNLGDRAPGQRVVTIGLSETVSPSGLVSARLKRGQLTKQAQSFVDFCRERLAQIVAETAR